MKVIVSTGGRFHAFHLAEQLQKRGYLLKLITTYFDPKRNAKGYDIDHLKVITNILPRLVPYGMKRVLRIDWPGSDYYANEYFDHWAKGKLTPCDIFVGWSSFSLHSLRRAKSVSYTHLTLPTKA